MGSNILSTVLTLVISLIPVLYAQVIALYVQLHKWKYQLLFDQLPYHSVKACVCSKIKIICNGNEKQEATTMIK